MSFIELYLHLAWSTYERSRLIDEAVEKRLWAVLAERCRLLKVKVFCIGGMPDHVHLLVSPPPGVAVAKLVSDLKGGSSYAMSRSIAPGRPFRWQGGYSAFTLRKEDVPVVGRYILDQKLHHPTTG